MAVLDIMEVKKSFHSFIDPMWEKGRFSRDSVYKILSDVLHKEAHVSKMTLQEMKKCADVLIDKDKSAYPCHKCEYCVAIRHFFPVCKKKVERSLEKCYVFKPKRDLFKESKKSGCMD